MLFIVGNGRRVRFWKDRWCKDSPLCVSFPSVFALSVDKEARVADIWAPWLSGVGTPVFQEPSMIGRWRKRKDS